MNVAPLVVQTPTGTEQIRERENPFEHSNFIIISRIFAEEICGYDVERRRGEPSQYLAQKTLMHGVKYSSGVQVLSKLSTTWPAAAVLT